MEVLSLQTGEKYSLKKTFSGGTGYTWYLMPSKGLNVVEKDTSLENTNLGGPVTRTWEVSSDKEGTYFLALMFLRPWESTKPEVDIIKFVVGDKTIVVHFSATKVVGYEKDGKLYNQLGKQVSRLESDLKEKVKVPEGISEVDFYFQNGQLYQVDNLQIYDLDGTKNPDSIQRHSIHLGKIYL